MERYLKTVVRQLLLLACLIGAGAAWANPTADFWQDVEARGLASDAPQPATFRLLALDGAAAMAYLQDADRQGIATAIAIPEPEGGFSDFLVTDSGTMAPGLKARFPEILSFKGMDTRGRHVRLDVSPLGFQAMVFDPEGIWVVRPESFEHNTGNYLVFRRGDLEMPGGMGICEVHGSHPDALGLDHVPAMQPMTEVGAVKRLYRTAVAANKYYVAKFGGTIAGGLAAVVTAVNRVNQVYEYELSVTLQLIANNDLLIFPADGSNGTDPFAANNGGVINSSTTVINGIIGQSNYDIGHVFTTGSGGVAGLGVVCNNSSKARGTTGLGNPVGDAFYIDFVSHEMGHQFRANHSFNSSEPSNCGPNRSGSTAYEPGSGTTIMGYAGVCASGENVQNHSDPQFHAISLQEINNFINNTNTGGSCSADSTNPNQMPVIDAGSLTNGYVIPAQTPFFMSGTASDADGADTVMYSWEQWDRESVGSTLPQGDTGANPLFRSWPPKASGVRYFPSLSTILGGPAIKGEIVPTTNRTLKFRLTARDRYDDAAGWGFGRSQSADVSVTVNNNAGPFKVTAPAGGASWTGGQVQTVTWDVAGTNTAPVNCTSVDIDLSVDGGQTFPVGLASTVANSGSASITVPAVSTTQGRVRVSCANNIFFNISPGNFTVSPGGSAYTVGGTVSGLTGSGLALKLNGGASLPVGSNGPFTFPVGLPSGTSYAVTVAAQPVGPAQVCTVANGNGTIGSGNVTNVQVTCSTQTPTSFTVGGSVVGLTGSGLKVKLNSGSNLALNANGPFSFATQLPDGASYLVKITAQPSGQTCVVQNASGTIQAANVTDVVVDCNAPVPTYTVGGTVSGLEGTGLALLLNGGSSLAIAADGSFTFPGALASGSAYAVTVGTQPTGPAQTCAVANGGGTIAGANVTDVSVTCVTDLVDLIFADDFEGDGGLACEPLQLFQDPGFEATVDYENPYWDSTDSLGGTSFCDDSCDDGGSFVARTGEWFVWMGGWDEANTADLSQSVTFPAGQPRFLNYWMVNQIEGDATARLHLLIDGTQVQDIAAGGNAQDWELTTFQIPAQYLDGQAHTVKFDWSADAPGGAVGGVMMDDVTLDCEAGVARRAPPAPFAGAVRRHRR